MIYLPSGAQLAGRMSRLIRIYWTGRREGGFE